MAGYTEIGYINSEREEREIKETTPFTITSKKKYLGINLLRRQKDLYSENCKLLMKEIEEDTNKWKDTLCSWTGRISIVKMTVLPRTIYTIPIKLPRAFFTDLEQKSLICVEI